MMILLINITIYYTFYIVIKLFLNSKKYPIKLPSQAGRCSNIAGVFARLMIHTLRVESEGTLREEYLEMCAWSGLWTRVPQLRVSRLIHCTKPGTSLKTIHRFSLQDKNPFLDNIQKTRIYLYQSRWYSQKIPLLLWDCKALFSSYRA